MTATQEELYAAYLDGYTEGYRDARLIAKIEADPSRLKELLASCKR